MASADPSRLWPDRHHRPLRALRGAGVLIAGCMAIGLVSSPAASAEALTVHVEASGVVELTGEALAAHLDRTGAIRSEDLHLTTRGRSVRMQLDDGGDGRFDAEDRLRFVASTRRQPTSLHDPAPLAVFRLHRAGDALAGDLGAGPEPSEPPASAVEGAVFRRLCFERDLIRLPVTRDVPLEGLESTWFWATLSERASTALEIDLGSLADRARTTGSELSIRVHLLGWSTPEVPDGETQHQVDALLDGRPIGATRWDGRSPHVMHLTVPIDTLRTEPRLALTVPSRRPSSGADPIIDVVHVDRVEVDYPVRHIAPDGRSPLIVPPSRERRWLPTADGRADVELVADAAWTAEPSDGGWLLPPTETAIELWAITEDDLRQPLAITPTSAAPAIRSAVDYVMIAPRSLLDGTRRLADVHRRRGLDVEVVEARAIFDTYGGGFRSASAIRAFLDDVLGHSPELRFVLLVGDADWLTADDVDPPGAPAPTHHDRLPTDTVFSLSGPAASDHHLAASAVDSIVPRFAVGRLPVADVAELAAWIDKIRAYLAAPAADPTVLMLSDRTRISVRRSNRVRDRLVADGSSVRTLDGASDRALDAQMLTAFDAMPAIVHFSGHGSRHTWQLGDAFGLSGASFFERDEVAELPVTVRPPVVISVSCATAPFDHPNADSLGERMVLRVDGGAIAFLGASARLYTQPRFGELVVRALLDGRTIGEAMVSAKRQVRSAETSRLYNLLGDPSLGIR